MQNTSAPSLQTFVSFIKNDPGLRGALFSMWAMSFVNALIKAGAATCCMLAVYGIKWLFAKKDVD